MNAVGSIRIRNIASDRKGGSTIKAVGPDIRAHVHLGFLN